MGALEYFLRVFSDPARTWRDFERLARRPGCRCSSRACSIRTTRRAVEHGAAGVIVSNHGGRQIDGCIAALDALPRVAAAVGDRTTVLFDSGIRRGSDVIKAVASARSVLVGRPYCFGLAVAGEQGVRDVLSNLFADLDLTLGLAGYTSFAELGPETVIESKPAGLGNLSRGSSCAGDGD